MSDAASFLAIEKATRDNVDRLRLVEVAVDQTCGRMYAALAAGGEVFSVLEIGTGEIATLGSAAARIVSVARERLLHIAKAPGLPPDAVETLRKSADALLKVAGGMSPAEATAQAGVAYAEIRRDKPA